MRGAGAVVSVAPEVQGLLRAAFDHAPIGMALWSLERERDFRPIEVNRSMCDLIGRSAEELLDTPPRDLVHPDDVDVGRDAVIAMLRGERTSCKLEKRFLRGDGAVIWAEVTLSIARVEDGGAAYGICQFQDVTARREAHEALRASEQRLRKLVQTAHEGIWVLDTRDCTAFVNGRLAEMLGYRMEEMLGRPVYDFVAEHDRPVLHARLAARRRGVADSRETRLVRKDGSPVWVILSGSPLTGEHGEYVGTLGMLADISDRKLREQALRASEERYRNIVETTSQGVWMIDADHRTTFVNRRMAEMLGYAVDEMLGRPVGDFAAGGAPVDDQRSGGEREVCYVRKDGSEMWGLMSGSPLSDGHGGYGGALAMVTDITERKRADSDVARLAAIVESSPEAIFSLDMDGNITTWNAAAERLYGWSRDEILGRPAHWLVPAERTEEVQAVAESVRAGAQLQAYRTTATRSDGSVIEVEPSVSAIEDASGRVVGVFAIVRGAPARDEAG